MLSREERIFGELLLARGLVARDVLEEYERTRAKNPSAPSLADVLIGRGDLESLAAADALDEARAIHGALEPDLLGQTKLGEFRLLREIGRGGMGIIYEAEQEPLGRRVALKVLPAGAALDERLAIRFLREARAAARLSHPGIVAVYASGRAAGVLYFAMALVEGRSLADVVAEGPVEPLRAARLTADVAAALHHAHLAGLIHRDVKPGNVLLGPDDSALLTDFGLVHDTVAESFTLSQHVLGTPAFLSPEHSLGGPAGVRGDVYGLGAVLYALLAGRPPYLGEVPSVVLAKVLAGPPPPLPSLRRDLPEPLIAICAKAMARDPEQRYANARQLEIALRSFLDPAHPAASRLTAPPPAVARVSATRRRTLWTCAAAAGVLATVGLWWVKSGEAAIAPARGESRVLRFAPVPVESGIKSGPSLSPDGTRIAYSTKSTAGHTDVIVQDLATNQRTSLRAAGGGVSAETPAFSPDGGRVAFMQGSALHRRLCIFRIDGGELDCFGDIYGYPAWSPDGREIVIAEGPENVGIRRLRAVDLQSRRFRVLQSLDGTWPAWSPSGLRLVVPRRSGGEWSLWTLRPDGSDLSELLDAPGDEWGSVWTDGGRTLTYAANPGGTPSLWRVPVDETTGKATGAPALAFSNSFASVQFDFTFSSGDKRLAFTSQTERGRVFRLALDRGTVRVAGPPSALPHPPSAALCPQPSPDGSALAFTALSPEEDIATLDIHGEGEPRFLTNDSFHDRAPRWSPDGRRVAFHSDRSGNFEIWVAQRDGSGLRRVTATNGAGATGAVWSMDGTRLAYHVEGQGGFVIPAEGKGAGATPLAANRAESAAFEPSSWSPDGELLAGSASGIVVFDFSKRAFRRLADAGEGPVFLPDGRALLFVRDRAVWRVDVRGGDPVLVYDAAPSGLPPCLGPSVDGRNLFFSLTASSSELWIADVDGAHDR